MLGQEPASVTAREAHSIRLDHFTTRDRVSTRGSRDATASQQTNTQPTIGQSDRTKPTKNTGAKTGIQICTDPSSIISTGKQIPIGDGAKSSACLGSNRFKTEPPLVEQF
jgi:hypothetical protein